MLKTTIVATMCNNLSCKLKVMAQFLVNVLTCDYIDFYCHIWEHWALKRISPLICSSFWLFVYFNNANTVSAEMWVWGFGNHKWYKSLKSRVEDEWLDKDYLQYFHMVLCPNGSWTNSSQFSKADYRHSEITVLT